MDSAQALISSVSVRRSWLMISWQNNANEVWVLLSAHQDLQQMWYEA